jgi:uncharacterized protein YqjF (DUF2071 family)
MAGLVPESRVTLPVLRQAWRTVAFLHFAYDPDDVRPLLPDRLEVQTYDGVAWVSITPLVVAAARLPGMPSAFAAPPFAETNLRTYVRAPDGTDGLWFFSLDCASRAFTLAARAAIGANYVHAALDVSVADGLVTYRGRRDDVAEYEIAVRTGAPLGPSDRDAWLTGRWYAYTRHLGALLCVPVAHEPWPLVTADVVSCRESLTVAAGLPPPTAPPVATFSPGVEGVRFGIARPLGVSG